MAHYKLRFFTKTKKGETASSGHSSYFFSEIPAQKEYENNTTIVDGNLVMQSKNGTVSPYEKFRCSLYQNPVSSGLVETNTIIFLGENPHTGDSKKVVAPIMSEEMNGVYDSAMANEYKLFFFMTRWIRPTSDSTR